jgi:hypothetical protein
MTWLDHHSPLAPVCPKNPKHRWATTFPGFATQAAHEPPKVNVEQVSRKRDKEKYSRWWPTINAHGVQDAIAHHFGVRAPQGAALRRLLLLLDHVGPIGEYGTTEGSRGSNEKGGAGVWWPPLPESQAAVELVGGTTLSRPLVTKLLRRRA